MSKKELFISYENTMLSLNLNVEDFKHMLKVFNINSRPKVFSQEQYVGFESYLKKIGHKILKINQKYFIESKIEPSLLSLEELINNRKFKNNIPLIKETINTKVPTKVKEKINQKITLPKEKIVEVTGIIGKEKKLINQVSKKDRNILINNSFAQTRYALFCEDCKKNNVEPIDFKLYKTFAKDYPINSDFTFNDVLLYTDTIKENCKFLENFRKVKNPKYATKLFNKGYIIYYTLKNKYNSLLCKLDTTKQFATNLSEVTTNYKYYIFDFYTKGETFDISQIEKNNTNKGKIYTKEEDKKILDFYNNPAYSNTKKKNNGAITLKELSIDLNIDTKSIRARAVELGFTNFKKPTEKKWSEDELKLLDECAGKYNPKKIEKIFRVNGFTRGFVAIGIKLTRRKLSRKLTGELEFNLKTLSDAMGVDSHFFYDNNRLEKLKAIKENNQIIFTKQNIGEYLINNPYDYSLAKIDAKWFIETILSAKHEEDIV